ncbi:transcription factor E2F6 [Menidia menidia]
MVKCVVSGCPNRKLSLNRGTLNRPPKRFFDFPKDPARVKVWLAALRESDRQDPSEHHLICEDHFLPEDIGRSGVSGDAIPIMPPCLDGPWGARPEEEEEQWDAVAGGNGLDDDHDDDHLPFNTNLVAPHIPPLDPPEEVPDATEAPGDKMSSVPRWPGPAPGRTPTREDVSLGVLTQRFLQLFLRAPDGCLDLRQVTRSLNTRRRRLYDVTNVLEGIRLLEKKSANTVQWIGSCPASSLLGQRRSLGETESLRLVEETLDSLIKSCAKQLFDMTDHPHNATLAYVTQQDVALLPVFHQQTAIVVKAPEETRLEVPAPREDSIQVHLKGGRGPITVAVGDFESDGSPGCFLTLEESRIKTARLRPESSGLQSA